MFVFLSGRNQIPVCQHHENELRLPGKGSYPWPPFPGPQGRSTCSNPEKIMVHTQAHAPNASTFHILGVLSSPSLSDLFIVLFTVLNKKIKSLLGRLQGREKEYGNYEIRICCPLLSKYQILGPEGSFLQHPDNPLPTSGDILGPSCPVFPASAPLARPGCSTAVGLLDRVWRELWELGQKLEVPSSAGF